jgi:sporulation and spore germination protein/immunoglobulin-like protein involved in spore germination
MNRKLPAVVVVVGVLVAAWFALSGGGHRATRPATSTAATAVSTVPVQAYFYLGAELVPVSVQVPRAGGIDAAARALLAGPPFGYRTAVPAGTTFAGMTVAGGTARATFSGTLAGAPRTAQAQIVYTLTQFPKVTAVRIDAGGAPVSLSNGAEKAIVSPATRGDYTDLTSGAPIFVSAPIRDSTVTTPVRVAGTASVFEGAVAIDAWSGGKIVKTDSVSATLGAPNRGTFTDSLDLAPGRYRLVFYEPSATDGSHLHTTTVNIVVTR